MRVYYHEALVGPFSVVLGVLAASSFTGVECQRQSEINSFVWDSVGLPFCNKWGFERDYKQLYTHVGATKMPTI